MSRLRSLLPSAVAALIGVSLWLPAPSNAQGQAYACTDKDALIQLAAPLPRTARRVAAGQSLTIVALGSSSTAGAGASGAAASYPSRLEAELKSWFPNLAVTVVNRGVNGEEARDMLARFDDSVAAYKPDLVLWQIGTNAVLRDDPLGPFDDLFEDGLRRIKALGADVVVIDPQFAPKVIAKPDIEDMVSVIAATAAKRGVDLFRRFAVMRSWYENERIPFEAFTSPDQLHMNDWGYACIAKLIGDAIVEASTRPFTAAHATTRPAAVRAN
jgi:acyl-CoA thioesterase I